MTGEVRLRVARVADILRDASALAGLLPLKSNGGASGDDHITASFRLVRDGHVYRVVVTEEDFSTAWKEPRQ